MKNRNLFTNILSILIIVALAFFLLVQFNVFSSMGQSARDMIGIVSLGVAILSVILIDIVFPVVDNRARLREKKYLILLIVKVILFAAAVAVLLMFHPFGVIKNTTVALVTFIVLYFVQFFINLDAKPDDDDEDDYDEEDSSDDVSAIEEPEVAFDDETVGEAPVVAEETAEVTEESAEVAETPAEAVESAEAEEATEEITE